MCGREAKEGTRNGKKGREISGVREREGKVSWRYRVRKGKRVWWRVRVRRKFVRKYIKKCRNHACKNGPSKVWLRDLSH